MAKVLKFVDGTTVSFTDTSTLSNMTAVVSKFADLDPIRKAFETADNLISGTFDGESIAQVVYTGCNASVADGNITAHFTTRPFTHDEIVDARLADLEDSLLG